MEADLFKQADAPRLNACDLTSVEKTEVYNTTGMSCSRGMDLSASRQFNPFIPGIYKFRKIVSGDK